MLPPYSLFQVLGLRNVEVLVHQRLDDVQAELASRPGSRCSVGRRRPWPRTIFWAGLMSSRIVRGSMRDGVAPVDVDRRAVVVEEELALVVADHDDDVGLGRREAALQLVQAGLDAVDLLVEDFAVDLVVAIAGSASSEQLVVGDALAGGHCHKLTVARVVLRVDLPQLSSEETHERAVRRPEAPNYLRHVPTSF